MKCFLAGVLALGLFPLTACAGHYDYEDYEDDDCRPRYRRVDRCDDDDRYVRQRCEVRYYEPYRRHYDSERRYYRDRADRDDRGRSYERRRSYRRYSYND